MEEDTDEYGRTTDIHIKHLLGYLWTCALSLIQQTTPITAGTGKNCDEHVPLRNYSETLSF